MTMHLDQQFEELVQKKYDEAKNSNVRSIILDQEILGGLTLFINDKPAFSIAQFIAGDDTLYVGATEIIPTS